MLVSIPEVIEEDEIETVEDFEQTWIEKKKSNETQTIQQTSSENQMDVSTIEIEPYLHYLNSATFGENFNTFKSCENEIREIDFFGQILLYNLFINNPTQIKEIEWSAMTTDTNVKIVQDFPDGKKYGIIKTTKPYDFKFKRNINNTDVTYYMKVFSSPAEKFNELKTLPITSSKELLMLYAPNVKIILCRVFVQNKTIFNDIIFYDVSNSLH